MIVNILAQICKCWGFSMCYQCVSSNDLNFKLNSSFFEHVLMIVYDCFSEIHEMISRHFISKCEFSILDGFLFSARCVTSEVYYTSKIMYTSVLLHSSTASGFLTLSQDYAAVRVALAIANADGQCCHVFATGKIILRG